MDLSKVTNPETLNGTEKSLFETVGSLNLSESEKRKLVFMYRNLISFNAFEVLLNRIEFVEMLRKLRR